MNSPLLLDTSAWIAMLRRSSARETKLLVAPFLNESNTYLAEPIMFELMRQASSRELPKITKYLSAFPMLSTPADLWARAADLGRRCAMQGTSAGSLDLLIAAIAIAHDAVLVTFDTDYQQIAKASALQCKLLRTA